MKVVPRIADEVEKRVVGLADRAVLVHHQDAHDVRADQAAEAGVAGAEGFFGPLTRGNVPEHPLNADDVAVRVVDGRLEYLHVNRLAVGLAVFFDVLEDLSRRDDSRVVPAIFLGQVPRKQVVVGLALELLPGEADFVEIVLIRVDQPALEILAEHVQRQALDQRAVAGFRMPQIIVRPFSTDRIAHRVLEDARLEVVA